MSEGIERELGGKELLKSLESENRYLFHGSDQPFLESLEPRQAYNIVNGTRVKDGEPAVFSSHLSDIAIFMAMFNEKNCPKGFLSGFSNDKDGLTLRATKKAFEQLDESSKGYVYIFNKEDFIQQNPVQWVSYKHVIPVQTVEVSVKDLPENIEIKEDNSGEIKG